MNSEHRIVTCIQQAARDLNLEVPSNDRAKDIIGLGLLEAVARLFGTTEPTEVDAIANAYRGHFLGDAVAPSELFDGAEHLLKTLSESGHLLAVATGKSRRGLDKDFASSGLGHYFDTSRCADETHSKPHPQMMLDILDRLGVEAQRALMIGDTEYDMQLAVNAGTHGLGISHGVHEKQRLLDNGALHCVDSLPEILEWLNR